MRSHDVNVYQRAVPRYLHSVTMAAIKGTVTDDEYT